MLGMFACKRAAVSLGGENPTGTRRRRHDYRSQVPTVAAKAFVLATRTTRGVVDERRGIQTLERVAERWKEEVGRGGEWG